MTPLDPMDVSWLRRRLLLWYSSHKRDLAWRKTKVPYRILVSEIMLQQTQVKTVIPYYQKFIRRFPTLAVLARASSREVMKYWAGLGYYRRAVHLQEAAKEIVNDRGAKFPRIFADIKKLPGVGDYTAAAMASIAFGEPVAVVDGNVIRVLCRLFGLAGDPLSSPLKQKLRGIAQEILDKKRPGDFNQALMELGALVCLPRIPDCPACPWAKVCVARREGSPERLPQLPARKPTERLERAVGVLAQLGKVLLRQRKQGKLRGLWEFPGTEVLGRQSQTRALQGYFREEFGVNIKVMGRIADFTHSIMRFKIHVQAFRCGLSGTAPKIRSGCWVAFSGLSRYPLGSAEQTICKALLKSPVKKV